MTGRSLTSVIVGDYKSEQKGSVYVVNGVIPKEKNLNLKNMPTSWMENICRKESGEE